MKKISCIFLFLFLSFISGAQDEARKDSLERALENEMNDSMRVRTLISLQQEYRFFDMNQAEKYISQAVKISTEAGLHSLLGESLVLYADVLRSQGNYPAAMDKALKAISVYEKLRDHRGIAKAKNVMGLIYWRMNEPDKAIAFFKESAEYSHKVNDSLGLARTMDNISIIFKDKGEYDMALQYNAEAVAVFRKYDKLYSLSISLLNRSIIFAMTGELDKALSLMEEAYGYAMKDGDKGAAGSIMVNIATVYYEKKQYPIAIQKFRDAIALSESVNDPEAIKSSLSGLILCYKETGDYKSAFENYEKYTSVSDSLLNESKIKEVTQLEMKHTFDKKLLADSLEYERRNQISEANLREERTQKAALFGGLALVLIFALLIYNRLRVIRKQKIIIEDQKHEVDEKQKEIIDSLSYAKRLQNAIMATPEEIKKHLPESFLLYKPKDIVAGDFYFFEEKDGYIFIAAADCTGHGVPGAMVSVICSNALTRCVNEFELKDPGKILDDARKLVISTFTKSSEEVKDGMDISLAVINKSNKTILWAGANNPLWMKQNNSEEIISIKPDKQPIGKGSGVMPFTTHKINISDKTMFYLFTDGYADQFGGKGGKGGKKFKYSNLKNLLADIGDKEPELQKRILEDKFNEWKGSFEQVDDVCIIGVKI